MKILLADDSMTAQNMGKKILTEAGYEVVAVSNGAAAVKKIAEQRPDVAVLDVYMPGYTGLEVCERLKTAHDTTHMPVLLTVGRMEPFKPEEGSRVKADGIIIKPFEASDLLAAIQKIEQRLSPARTIVAAAPSSDPTAIYEKTQKIQIPYLQDFKDASYEEWKVSAPGHVEAGDPRATVEAVPAFSVPDNLGTTPALGMDELEIVPPAEPPAPRATQMLDSPPAATMRPATAHIQHKTEVVPPPPAPTTQPEAAPKSISGVWRALDKARDWFGGAPEAGTTGKPVDDAALAHIADVPEEKLAEAFSAPPVEIAEQNTHSGLEPALPVDTLEATPIAEGTKTIHELAYEAVQSFGATAEPAQPKTGKDELLEHTSAKPVEVLPARDPHLEVAPSVTLHSAEIAPHPDLEPTVRSRDSEPTIVTTDPALVTDVNELHSAFPTRFGVENPDDVPVGIASNFPHLYADAAEPASPEAEQAKLEVAPVPEVPARAEAASAPVTPRVEMSGSPPPASKSAWVARETTLDEHESGLKLHDEMHQAFAAVPAAGEDLDVELVEPGAETAEEPSHVGTAADPELAAAMAAAMGTEMVPSVAQAVSQTAGADSSANEEDKTALVADIVQRVVDTMKPELIRRIAAELGKKK
ncbi:MAG: response regulator [Acidobacteriales bacterium]|nr:response regulator [Terriglobales bacterium]